MSAVASYRPRPFRAIKESLNVPTTIGCRPNEPCHRDATETTTLRHQRSLNEADDRTTYRSDLGFWRREGDSNPRNP